MNTCSKGHQFTEDICPKCNPGGMSVADDSLDQMVQAASVPNLSTLFQKAKDAGMIGGVSVYGEGT